MHIRNKNRGFTLIELLVAIAIIGILSSIVIINLSSAKQKANNARFYLEANQIALAMQLYYDKNGDWPNFYSSDSLIMYACHFPCIPDFADDSDPSNKFYPKWDASYYCADCNYGFDIFDFNNDDKPDIGNIFIVGSAGSISRYIPCITSDTFYIDTEYCGQ